MKITPRPITAADKVDQSRDMVGISKWAQSSRTIGFILFILGWFTIPAEVLLRRDFGQRWFTVVNFYGGLFLLIVFASLQYLWAAIWGWGQGIISHIASAINPYYKPPDSYSSGGIIDESMTFILLAYLLLGSYHLFKIWWRNRTNTALHSFDDGTSRTEPLAGVLMAILNVLTAPFVWLYKLLVPLKERLGVKQPKLINDRTAFANTVFEPLLLFVLAFWLGGIASIWLFMTAIAVAIHANWKETARLNKILDFRDSVIEAKVMMQLKAAVEQDEMAKAAAPVRIMQQAAAAIKDNPQVVPHMEQKYPDLMNIIEEMNRDKGHN